MKMRVALLIVCLVVVAGLPVQAQSGPTSTVTVVEDATPNSTQNFIFSGAGGFILDDAVPSDNDLYPKQRSFVLANGVYTFGQTTPSNWRLTGIDCSPDGDSSVVVTLPSVEITLDGGDVTCTFRNELTVNIYALKYRDNNGNGVRNAGEPVLAGWTITASRQPTGTLIFTQTTTSLGRANFSFIPAGTWKVCEVLLPGWVNTQPGGAEPCHMLTLAPGRTASVLFGNRQ